MFIGLCGKNECISLDEIFGLYEKFILMLLCKFVVLDGLFLLRNIEIFVEYICLSRKS